MLQTCVAQSTFNYTCSPDQVSLAYQVTYWHHYRKG